MNGKPFTFILPIVFLLGCVSRATVKPGYDFSRIHRLSVASFEGDGGTTVSNEFIRQLLVSRLDVSEQRAGADAVLTGSVTDYKPSQKLMVLLGNTHRHGANGQTVVVTNPVVSLSGSELTNEGPAFGLPNAQVVSVSATVGVIAHLVDARTGDVVWSDEFSYEGLDVQSALQATVSSLVNSLGKVIPALQARQENR